MPNISLFVLICLLHPISIQQIQLFQNPPCHFLVKWRNILMQKLRKSTEHILRKMCQRRTDIQIQTDGQSNRADFTGPLPERWKFGHVFQKFENKMFLI